MMYKFKDFFLNYRLTAGLATFVIIISLYILIFIQNLSQFGWFSTFWIIVAASFCYEHAAVAYDPDTHEFRFWRNLGIIVFVAFLVLLGVLGNSVIALYK